MEEKKSFAFSEGKNKPELFSLVSRQAQFLVYFSNPQRRVQKKLTTFTVISNKTLSLAGSSKDKKATTDGDKSASFREIARKPSSRLF